MIGRRRTAGRVATTAREALRDTRFDSSLPGVVAVEVAYDPGLWTRLPRPGEDRTDWAAAHLAAYAEDLGLSSGHESYRAAAEALDAAADTLLTHTVDLMALPHPVLGPGSVAYVDLTDTELGLLEHGSPEVFLTLADLRPGQAPPSVRWFPSEGPGAVRHAGDGEHVDGGYRGIQRSYRSVPIEPEALHLYGSAFYGRPGGAGEALRVLARARVETTTRGAV